MARPSVKAERTAEILDAFERCVARLGIEGTTLERIAEESGLRRSLLRYHIGNREQMVQALADRFIESSKDEARKLLVAMPAAKTSLPLLNYLFSNSNEHNRRRILVAEALVSGADLYPAIKERMSQWYGNFVQLLCQVVRVDFPHASDAACREVAWGIVSLVFNVQLLMALSNNDDFLRDGRRAAERLLNSLNLESEKQADAHRVQSSEDILEPVI